MKSIMITVVLSLAAVVGAMGQSDGRKMATPALRCTGPDGRACSQQRVNDLAGVVKRAGGGGRADLAQIKSLALSSSNGAVKCEQVDGQHCTAEQARSLYEIGRAINITITVSNAQ